MQNKNKTSKTIKYFGSREWANSILRQGIKACLKKYPDFSIYMQRTLEIKYSIQFLEDYGRMWHAKTLSFWLHRLYRRHAGIKKESQNSKNSDTLDERERDVFIAYSAQEALDHILGAT